LYYIPVLNDIQFIAMSNNKSDYGFKDSKNPIQKRGDDLKLSRREALKRAAKQVFGLAGLFLAVPAISSDPRSPYKQSDLTKSNYYNYSDYYSYYCEDYYGYIYNQPGAPYQSYQGYWEKIYSSYCLGYYSYSKTDSIPYANYYSYSKTDSIPYYDYFSYQKNDSILYYSYYTGK
jgi:hypothetical protein